MALIILTACLIVPSLAPAASVKLNLEFTVSYNVTSNMDGVDPKVMEPTKASYLNFLVGGGVNYKFSKVETGIKGAAGYTYYLTADGKIEDIADAAPQDYSYIRALASAWVRYTGRILTVDLTDDIVRTRSLSDVYGPQTDALGDRYLFTDNVASLQFRFKVRAKTRLLAKYSYEMLVFPKPENEAVQQYQPADSTEHRGYFRAEYDLNTRNTVFFDAQGGQRIFATREISGFETHFVDYNFYQGLLGYRHRFNERNDLEIAGGAYYRDFINEVNLKFEDYTTPLGRVTFNSELAEKYKLNLQGEYGTSTYGQNIFYDYINGTASFKYFFTRKLIAQLDALYNYNTFDRKRNERELLWKEDRVDSIYVGRVLVFWDLIQKNKEPILRTQVGYEHKVRDSNLDSRQDYLIPGMWVSYDTTIDYYFVEISFLPMLLVGR